MGSREDETVDEADEDEAQGKSRQRRKPKKLSSGEQDATNDRQKRGRTKSKADKPNKSDETEEERRRRRRKRREQRAKADRENGEPGGDDDVERKQKRSRKKPADEAPKIEDETERLLRKQRRKWKKKIIQNAGNISKPSSSPPRTGLRRPKTDAEGRKLKVVPPPPPPLKVLRKDLKPKPTLELLEKQREYETARQKDYFVENKVRAPPVFDVYKQEILIKHNVPRKVRKQFERDTLNAAKLPDYYAGNKTTAWSENRFKQEIIIPHRITRKIAKTIDRNRIAAAKKEDYFKENETSVELSDWYVDNLELWHRPPTKKQMKKAEERKEQAVRKAAKRPSYFFENQVLTDNVVDVVKLAVNTTGVIEDSTLPPRKNTDDIAKHAQELLKQSFPALSGLAAPVAENGAAPPPPSGETDEAKEKRLEQERVLEDEKQRKLEIKTEADRRKQLTRVQAEIEKQRARQGKGGAKSAGIERALQIALETRQVLKELARDKTQHEKGATSVSDFTHDEVLEKLTRLPTKQYIAARTVLDNMKTEATQCYIYQEEKERELLRNRIELLRREKFQLAQTLFNSAEQLKVLRHQAAYQDLRELSKAPTRMSDDSLAGRIEKTISSSGTVARQAWSKIFNKISGSIRRKRQNIERAENIQAEQRNLRLQMQNEQANLANRAF